VTTCAVDREQSAVRVDHRRTRAVPYCGSGPVAAMPPTLASVKDSCYHQNRSYLGSRLRLPMTFLPRVRLRSWLALPAFAASALVMTGVSAGDVTGGTEPTDGTGTAVRLSARGASRLPDWRHLVLPGSARIPESKASEATHTAASCASGYRLGSSRCDKRSTLKSGKRSRVLPDTIEWEEPDDEVDDDWDSPFGLHVRYTACTHVGWVVRFGESVPAYADCPSSLSISSVRLRC
jgi:hypothetical protein